MHDTHFPNSDRMTPPHASHQFNQSFSSCGWKSCPSFLFLFAGSLKCAATKKQIMKKDLCCWQRQMNLVAIKQLRVHLLLQMYRNSVPVKICKYIPVPVETGKIPAKLWTLNWLVCSGIFSYFSEQCVYCLNIACMPVYVA